MLKDHQVEGLNWLINLYRCNANGLLADQMGLGKTIQTIAFLAYLAEVERVKGPHLIVAPLSVVDNWKQEITKWFPDCRVNIISALKSDRNATKKIIESEDYDVLITSYEGLTKNLYMLEPRRFVYFILDEAHKIKNDQTQFSAITRKVPSEYRLLLTGTPLSNNTAELWSLLNFVMPNIFDTKSIIEDLFSKKTELENMDDAISQTELVESIHRIIRPFMLRRLKQDTNIVLKPKKEVHVYCPMSQMQRELYKDIVMAKREGDRHSLSNIIMQLRKASIHPYLFPYLDTEAEAIGNHLVNNSGKFVILDKMLEKFVLKEDKKVLIFSQFTAVLDILEDFLSLRQIPCYRLDGQTPVDDRNAFMRSFNSDQPGAKVFILSTRAGGLGVNLTAASIVIILDSDWNPQMDLQAMDRAHRIGQTKDVFVYRLVTKDSIEEKIIERQVMKLKFDFILLEKGRTVRRKQKNYVFSLNKLGEDEIKDLAYFGVSNILKVEGDEDELAKIDIEKLLQDGEKNAEKLDKVLEQKIVEFGEKALEFRTEHNYMQFVNKFGEEDQKKKLTLADIQEAYMDGERRKREREDRLLIAQNLEAFKRSVPRPEPWQFYKDPETLHLLRAKQERLFFCQRVDLKAKDEYKMTKEERKTLEDLEKSGFGHWKKSEFDLFVVYSGKYGRLNIEDVSNHFITKSTDEVYRYACVFWHRLNELGEEGLAVLRYIEKREYKIYVRNTICTKVAVVLPDLSRLAILWKLPKHLFPT